MDEKRFWDIIGFACKHGALTEWDARLEDQLALLAPEEIVGFDILLDQKAEAAYTSDLHAACYTLNGGASDDGFYYFRLWLVGMGKVVYDAALANADSLADLNLTPGFDVEADLYAATIGVWEERLGRSVEAFYELHSTLTPAGWCRRPEGEEWWDVHDEAEFRRRLPRLAARD